MSKSKVIPTCGATLLELEAVCETLIDVHELQRGDILAIVNTWFDVHRPDAIETYVDGTLSPIMKYGPIGDKK